VKSPILRFVSARNLKLFFLLLASGPATAAALENDPIENSLAAHIAFLADDLLEGRGTGTAGCNVAARYVASQFQQMGLRPGGDSNRWFQEVPLLESRLDPEGTRAELRSGGETVVLEYNVEYLTSPSFSQEQETVTAPLVFAGFGVHAPELGYDDFQGLDLRGAIAVVLAKAPPRFPATRLAHHSHIRQKSKALLERGAVGMITVPTPKDLEESPWARVVIQSRFPAMRWIQSDGRPADAFEGLKASLRVSPAGAGRLFAQAPTPLTRVLEAANRSEPPRFPLGLTATVTTRSIQRRLSSPNVIGILPGSDPVLARESVVIAAHLDHQGVGTPVNGDAIYNGAYDNAIGVAMMLEIARELTREGQRPARTLVFAAVTAEEKGLRGSEYLATHLPSDAGRPVANLNLDMVLVTAPTRRYTILGIEHSTLRDPVEAAARQFDLELVPDPRPDRVTFVRSDQYSFIRQGVPAIFPKVASSPDEPNPVHGISPDTFTKEHYHRPSDDLSLPRDAESSVRFVRFMAEVALRVARQKEPPRWSPGDFFGETFQKGNADR
jgi:Zn-dependent M28 family amino/carboxypeptidase